MIVRKTGLLFAILLLGSIGCKKAEDASSGYDVKSGVDAPEADAAPTKTTPVSFEAQTARRSLIRKGNMTLRVEKTDETLKKISKLIDHYQGFVQTEESSDLESIAPTVTVVFRVPVNRLDDSMSEIEKCGTLLARHVTSEDVTTQVVDMDARVKTMLSQEEAYRQILRQTRKIADVMTVQDHLTKIRTEIESTQAQLKSLREQAAYSTLEIHLQQTAAVAGRTEDKGWLSETWADSSSALRSGLKGIVQAAIWLLMTAVFWLTPILLLWWLVRRASVKPRSPSAPPPPDSPSPPPFQPE